jgi:hypothetical protein
MRWGARAAPGRCVAYMRLGWCCLHAVGVVLPTCGWGGSMLSVVVLLLVMVV